MASLSLVNVCKTYKKGFEAVKDVNLDIRDKEFLSLVGPSGCGKSTTLDVYKRQRPYRVCTTSIRAMPCLSRSMCWRPTTNTIPVSYTHLDVYKRQVSL